MKVLHLGNLDKFLPSFSDFIRDREFGVDHKFIFSGDSNKFPLNCQNCLYLDSVGNNAITRYIYASYSIFLSALSADRVILHGIFNHFFIYILLVVPFAKKKSIWLIWGGDLYSPILNKTTLFSSIREFLKWGYLRKVEWYVTPIEGDFELAKKRYNRDANCISYFFYPSAILDLSVRKAHEELSVDPDNTVVKLLLGNSAAVSNCHEEIIHKLFGAKIKNLKIFAPLGYGDDVYRKKIVELLDLLGEVHTVELITDFLSVDDYHKLLSECSVVVFNHNRQQGLNTIIQALGNGALIFLRSEVTTFAQLKKWGFFAIDVSEIGNLGNILIDCKPELEKNKLIAERLFDELHVVKAWEKILDV